jgi:hypothetical protein
MLGGIETYRCPSPLGLFLAFKFFEWWTHQQKFFWHEGMYSSLSYILLHLLGILRRQGLPKGFLIHHIFKRFNAHLMLFLVWKHHKLMRRRSTKKNEEAKKQRLTRTKEMQARYSQEGRPYISTMASLTLIILIS